MTNERQIAGKIQSLLMSIAKKQVSEEDCDAMISDPIMRGKVVAALETIYDTAAELTTLINVMVLKSDSE